MIRMYATISLSSIADLAQEGDKVAGRLGWHIIDLIGKESNRETIDIPRFVSGQMAEHWGIEAWRSEKS